MRCIEISSRHAKFKYYSSGFGLFNERVALWQAWLPRRGPVQDSPLALCDAASVAQEDLQRAVLHFPHRTGETYLVAHNPDHRYAPQLLVVHFSVV